MKDKSLPKRGAGNGQQEASCKLVASQGSLIVFGLGDGAEASSWKPQVGYVGRPQLLKDAVHRTGWPAIHLPKDRIKHRTTVHLGLILEAEDGAGLPVRVRPLLNVFQHGFPLLFPPYTVAPLDHILQTVAEVTLS